MLGFFFFPKIKITFVVNVLTCFPVNLGLLDLGAFFGLFHMFVNLKHLFLCFQCGFVCSHQDLLDFFSSAVS